VIQSHDHRHLAIACQIDEEFFDARNNRRISRAEHLIDPDPDIERMAYV